MRPQANANFLLRPCLRSALVFMVLALSIRWIGQAQAATCGNGLIEPAEECDDNNGRSNDGCSSACVLEAGFCQGGTGMVSDPSFYSCDSASECANGQSCSQEECTPSHCSCAAGRGWFCNLECRGRCTGCGDRVVSGGEQCDDGNGLNNDGCSSVCRLEAVAAVPALSAWGTPTLALTMMLVIVFAASVRPKARD